MQIKNALIFFKKNSPLPYLLRRAEVDPVPPERGVQARDEVELRVPLELALRPLAQGSLELLLYLGVAPGEGKGGKSRVMDTFNTAEGRIVAFIVRYKTPQLFVVFLKKAYKKRITRREHFKLA